LDKTVKRMKHMLQTYVNIVVNPLKYKGILQLL